MPFSSASSSPGRSEPEETHLDQAVQATALERAGTRAAEIEGVAYTAGPGLVGALLTGAALARSLSFGWRVPAIGIHHLEGHLLAPMLEDPAPPFPQVALLVSGGHTMLIEVRAIGQYYVLGQTRDDAAGEAFDKVARLLGLEYPGGPAIQRVAASGDPARFPMPRTRLDGAFSFSGLKTAVRYMVRNLGPDALTESGGPADPQVVADLAAAFQVAAVDQLVAGLEVAADRSGATTVAVVGGVAANKALRDAVNARFRGLRVVIPPFDLCTDNAAMIAAAGWQRLRVHGPDVPGFDVDPSLAECA